MNTYILQRDGSPPFLLINSQSDWRFTVAQALFDKYGGKARSRKRLIAATITSKNTPVSKHFMVYKGKRSHCSACRGVQRLTNKRRALAITNGNEVKNKDPGRTRYGCEYYDVPLCNNDLCWYLYHGLNKEELEVLKK